MTSPRTSSHPDPSLHLLSGGPRRRGWNLAGAGLLCLGAVSLLAAGQWRVGWGGLLLAFLWVFLTERAQRQVQALHALQLQARQRADEAEQAHAAKAEFLASMSHEIRSPLNSLMGMVDLSLATELSDTQRDYLTVAQQSSRVVLQLIDEILDDARLQSGHVRYEYQPVALQAFAQRVLRAHALAAPRASVQFELLPLQDMPPTVMLDALRVEQVLNNLLHNAVKFTQAGFIRLSVTRRKDTGRGEELVFTVSDSGPGIAPDQQARIFESFVQAEQRADSLHPGTGLGLSISRRLAEGMQGTLALVQQDGPGASFELSLPLVLSHLPPPQQVSSELSAPAPVRPLPEVLLVEDQQMNQKVGQAMLARLGIQAVVAHHGAHAVAICQTRSFDVILMDVLMPVMDGLEATRQLRALWSQQGRGPLRILGMTAQVQQEAQARCRDAGMDDCLTKPISLKQLSAALGIPLQPAPSPTGVPVDDDQELDLARALDYALDPSGLPDLIKTFMESLAASRSAMDQALQAQDAVEIALQLHAFKGFMPIFAGESLSLAITELERRSRTESPAAIQLTWEAMAPRLDRLVLELTRTRQRYHSGSGFSVKNP